MVATSGGGECERQAHGGCEPACRRRATAAARHADGDPQRRDAGVRSLSSPRAVRPPRRHATEPGGSPMLISRRKLAVFLAVLAAAVLSVTSLLADDWKLTGSGTRVKTIAFIDIKVYDISHYMKELPATKSKQAVIDMDTGKKFVWTFKRDVPQEKVVNASKEAFAMNGYTDAAKIATYVSAFTGELKEGTHVTITYDPGPKNVTIKVENGGTQTIDGVDFMKAVWSVWFGKIDQPKLGDQLISKLP
jgi:hypothetical protein